MRNNRQVETEGRYTVSEENPPVHTIYNTTTITSNPKPKTDQVTVRSTVSSRTMEKNKNVEGELVILYKTTTKRTTHTKTHTKGQPTKSFKTEYHKETTCFRTEEK
ncbi:hypothetical protein E0198_002523 [Clavispora lusitaniae]|nr:hypothetical protein E0198_002523 [Clavispora lusitaniae]